MPRRPAPVKPEPSLTPEQGRRLGTWTLHPEKARRRELEQMGTRLIESSGVDGPQILSDNQLKKAARRDGVGRLENLDNLALDMPVRSRRAGRRAFRLATGPATATEPIPSAAAKPLGVRLHSTPAPVRAPLAPVAVVDEPVVLAESDVEEAPEFRRWEPDRYDLMWLACREAV